MSENKDKEIWCAKANIVVGIIFDFYFLVVAVIFAKLTSLLSSNLFLSTICVLSMFACLGLATMVYFDKVAKNRKKLVELKKKGEIRGNEET